MGTRKTSGEDIVIEYYSLDGFQKSYENTVSKQRKLRPGRKKSLACGLSAYQWQIKDQMSDLLILSAELFPPHHTEEGKPFGNNQTTIQKDIICTSLLTFTVFKVFGSHFYYPVLEKFLQGYKNFKL